MKKYLLITAILFFGFLRGEELFHGVNPANGQLVLPEKGLSPVFADEKVIKLISTLSEEAAFTFFYHENSTQIIDAEECLYDFIFCNGQISSKKVWGSDGILFSHEKWLWQGEELASHSYFNANEQLIYQNCFERDENSLTSIVYEEGKTNETQYSYEHGRLISCKDSEENETRYSYSENGLTASIITSKVSGTLRQFFSYNDKDELFEIIIDDGLSDDAADLDFSIRKRIEFIPSIKKPEIILLYSFDPAIGIEVIQKRLEGLYGKDAKLIYQELFSSKAGETEETFFDYDSLGHLTLIHDGLGNGIETFYDEENHLLRESLLVDNIPITSSIFSYNGLDQLIHKDQVEASGTTLPQEYIYNALNQIKTTIDALGNHTDFAYNPLGQVIEITHPPMLNNDGVVVRPSQKWEYNAIGKLVSYTDPDGVIYTEGSSLANMTNNPWIPIAFPLTLPNTKPEAIEPCVDSTNATGLKITFVDDKHIQAFICDALGRVLKKECFNAEGELVNSLEMLYSPAGRPILLKENDSISMWEYDHLGRIVKITKEAKSQNQHSTCYYYDSNGCLASICKPNGVSVSFTYDDLGCLNHIFSSDKSVDEPFYAEESILKQYDDENNCIGFLLPDYSAVSYEWEGNKLKRIYRIDDSGKIIYDFDVKSPKPLETIQSESEIPTQNEYTYDLNGNLICIASGLEKIELSYDALDRLILVKTDAQHSFAYTYDGLQRRRQRISYFEDQEISREQFIYDGQKEIGLIKEGILTELRLLDPRNECEVAIEIEGKIIDSPDFQRDSHFVPHTHNGKNGLWFNRDAIKYSYNSKSKHCSDESVLSSIDSWVKSNLSFEEKSKDQIDFIAHTFFKNAWLVMLGYYNEEASIGVAGNGELNDKVRVTIINGMLNICSWAEHNAMEVSKTHGDINVHYVYRPTRGWTQDLIRATLGKCGFPSVEAQLLAEMWKRLIAEMGGIEGGGTIIHYAHSIGAADTLSARHYLTPQEQRMIKVISLGSPLVIPHEGFASVINYISLRDGIRYLALFSKDHQFVYLDSYWGIPVMDHLLNSGTYKTLMENLGKAFIKEYIEKNKA